MPKQILYIDMDNVLVDFKSGINRLTKAERKLFKDRLDEVPGIFHRMEPMKDAVKSFQTLAKHFDVYILSTAPWENHTAWSDKLLWVKLHLGETAYKRVILTHHKNLNMGDYLIDDRTKNGVDKFTGEHIHFGKGEFKTWKAVVKHLSSKKTSVSKK